MIYDISQPVFGCAVYPGDRGPEGRLVCSMERGDLYNLTEFSMCAHNGTHVDAPFHFLREGKTVGQLPPEHFVGPAYVRQHCGAVTAEEAKKALQAAETAFPGAGKRLLFKGPAVVTEEAAKVLAAAGTLLVGVESQSVGPEEAPMAVHLILLRAETVLLEGIRAEQVPEGAYFLCSMPLALEGAEGAPCRAILLELSGGGPEDKKETQKA